ncbi:DeoR/GlpR family DNA-binding transcription regulator [bacterium]|nr:DeoR/GlpR family DNA-binding transcription regulator [bacterium]
MIPEERRNKILELVNNRENVTVEEIGKKFNISVITVRRDLDRLTQLGLLKKVHGGAMSIETIVDSPLHLSQKTVNIDAKRAIAKEAIKRINDGDFIIIESGTTCLELVRQLSGKRGLKVITASPNIATELGNISLNYNLGLEIISCGGILQPRTNFLVGPYAKSIFDSVRVDKAFLTVTAIDLKYGISGGNLLEAEITKAVLSCARVKIGLIDSSKFEKTSFVRIAPVTVFDEIITDRNLPKDVIKKYRKSKVKITEV